MSDGEGCKCFARTSGDCVCGADWSCGECAKLRAEVKALRNIVRHYGLMGDKQLDEVLEATQAGDEG